MGFLAFGHFLQIFGVTVIASSILVDIITPGTQGYGKMQFAITIVGVVVILMGLREIKAQHSTKLNFLLLITYTAGIMFMGLGEELFRVDPTQPILGPNAFSVRDLLINMFGFLPFGYLLVSNLLTNNIEYTSKTIVKVSILGLLAGLSLSLLIETSQHFFIPGRFSSIYDILGNGLGTVAGIGLYFLARKWDTCFVRQAI